MSASMYDIGRSTYLKIVIVGSIVVTIAANAQTDGSLPRIVRMAFSTSSRAGAVIP